MSFAAVALSDAYKQTTRGITVTVSPAFLEDRSDLANGIYAFAYVVTLENCGEHRVQLINRHWRIYSGGMQIADIKGEGVVGQQPVLVRGSPYKYTSWTVIHDPIGSMEGLYTFLSDAGEFFDVSIPRFDLLCAVSSSIH